MINPIWKLIKKKQDKLLNKSIKLLFPIMIILKEIKESQSLSAPLIGPNKITSSIVKCMENLNLLQNSLWYKFIFISGYSTVWILCCNVRKIWSNIRSINDKKITKLKTSMDDMELINWRMYDLFKQNGIYLLPMFTFLKFQIKILWVN